ncbi:hypothetical protein GQF61_01250 [Sphingobacterium sp. DK4209]|uniref:Uncharacterized protein n=1 Tax=Sphingobacterium zhuxiongii TaxID=2662364 RepID=A0A5Q0QF35_9SPHI|nr:MULTISPECIES: hypothetical protein [unclassified Sphingobacterium]MVZ64463.1 hypothetical protein [Sphingobacterium sp. DK4209]QGA25800.1 hypothetical protein GFH32_05460 [Sphingobacterium sp. dk4302]
MDSKSFEFTFRIEKHDWDKLIIDASLLLKLVPADQWDSFRSYIFDQLQDKDGSPQADGFKITQFKYSPQDSKGSFRLSFDIDRHFCCSDSNSCSNDYVDMKFSYLNALFQADGCYFNWTIQ